jgi:hypothetical protein
MQWLQRSEDFLGRYPHIVAALEAVSTFAAVVISLALAGMGQRANRTRLEADCFVGEVQSAGIDPQNPPRYVAISIRNTGLLPLRIPYAFQSDVHKVWKGYLDVSALSKITVLASVPYGVNAILFNDLAIEFSLVHCVPIATEVLETPVIGHIIAMAQIHLTKKSSEYRRGMFVGFSEGPERRST